MVARAGWPRAADLRKQRQERRTTAVAGAGAGG
eukprot:COSAG06_NODE_36768_length_443_cov_0.686047_1_plen_32_part_10